MVFCYAEAQSPSAVRTRKGAFYGVVCDVAVRELGVHEDKQIAVAIVF